MFIDHRISWDKGCNGLGASNPLSGNWGLYFCFEGFHCSVWSSYLGKLLSCSLSLVHLKCAIVNAFLCRRYLLKICLWLQGKEGVMTELRKELNVTDFEHGEILMKINSDELIKHIRWLSFSYSDIWSWLL